MTRILWMFALTVWSVVASASVAALDQHNVAPVDSYLNGGSNVYAWQQGVTAGVSGQLVQIDLFIGEAGTTRVSVNLGAPWQTDAPDWQSTVALQSGWNSLDLTTANILLAAGDEFAFGFHGQGDSIFPPAVAFSYGNAYTNGSLFLNGSSSQSVGHDMLFRTYVSSAPEPTTLALFGLGLAGLAVTRRRTQ